MADKTNLAYPERGWGQLLRDFIRPELTLINHAANGRSTLRFLNEGRWQLLMSDLAKDDYVLIQFAHNDSKKEDSSRYAAADTTYPQLLSRFIQDIRSKGAIPLLATSICRRNFNAAGELQDDLADYADAMRQVASKLHVQLFDLHQWHCAELARLGPAGSQPYFIQVPAGLYQKFPDGKTDNTHLNLQGASWVAQQFIRQLKQQQHPLAAYVWRELL